MLPFDYPIDEPPPFVVVKRRHNDKSLVTDSNDRETKLALQAISKIPEDARTVFQVENAKANAETEAKIWKYAQDSGELKKYFGLCATLIGINSNAPGRTELNARSQNTRFFGYQSLIFLRNQVCTIPGITNPYHRVQIRMKTFVTTDPPPVGTHIWCIFRKNCFSLVSHK